MLKENNCKWSYEVKLKAWAANYQSPRLLEFMENSPVLSHRNHLIMMLAHRKPPVSQQPKSNT